MAQSWTIKHLLELGERVLVDSTHVFEGHDHRSEAEELLAHVLKADLDELDPGYEPDARLRDRYLALIARRAGGEPFPLLVGHIEFYGLDLRVRPGVFVPRPSSELVVSRVLRRVRARRHPVVVDVCTGAGPIAVAVADELPHAEVWGSDIDAKGLDLGRENARAHGLKNVRFRRSDMFEGLPQRLAGRVDVVTGHVPYVPPDEMAELPSEVREHEPSFVITDDSEDGLDLIRRAVATAPRWLKPGGWLLLEVSDDLPTRIKRLCRRAGLEDFSAVTDADRLSVVAEARKPLRAGRSR